MFKGVSDFAAAAFLLVCIGISALVGTITLYVAKDLYAYENLFAAIVAGWVSGAFLAFAVIGSAILVDGVSQFIRQYRRRKLWGFLE